MNDVSWDTSTAATVLTAGLTPIPALLPKIDVDGDEETEIPPSNEWFFFGLSRNGPAEFTDTAIGIGFPPSTGVDDRDRFSSGMSSAADMRCCTWGLFSRERKFPGVLGDEDRVRWPSLFLREAGVAGCLMVDLSKLLEVIKGAPQRLRGGGETHTKCFSWIDTFPVTSHWELGQREAPIWTTHTIWNIIALMEWNIFEAGSQ